MAVLDWLQQLLGGGPRPQGDLARIVDRPYSADQGYQQPEQLLPKQDQPHTWDEAVDAWYGLTGIPDIQKGWQTYQEGGDPLAAFGQAGAGALNAASLAFPALKAVPGLARTIGPLLGDEIGAIGDVGRIRAWHASPHTFAPEPGYPLGRFDIGKVGTGQGSASYGKSAIYLAENPGVSGPGSAYDLEFTAKNLGKYDLNQGEQEVLRVLRAGGSDMDALGSLARGGGYTFEQAHDVLNRVKAAKSRLYEVDINAKPEDFLNWDKPLSAQSKQVQEALRPDYGDVTLRHVGENPNLGALYDLMVNRQSVGTFPTSAFMNEDLTQKDLTQLAMAHDPRSGQAIYESPVSYYSIRADANSPWQPSDVSNYTEALAQVGGDKSRVLRINARDPDVMSQRLRDAGIPGIRYLDQGSRFNPASLPDNPIANEARGFLERAGGDVPAALQAFKDSNPSSSWAVSERDEIRKVIEAAGRRSTSNYAVWTPEIITILRRYGLLPPLAAGGLLAAPGQGEAAQP